MAVERVPWGCPDCAGKHIATMNVLGGSAVSSLRVLAALGDTSRARQRALRRIARVNVTLGRRTATATATLTLRVGVMRNSVTLISSNPRVYVLKDRDPVGHSASRSVGFSKWTVSIGRTGFDTIPSILDPTLSLREVSRLTVITGTVEEVNPVNFKSTHGKLHAMPTMPSEFQDWDDGRHLEQDCERSSPSCQ